jgi:dTDP-glucose 4,6-dehydratase
MECERLVSFYAENLPEKRFSILRLFNAYGPGQRDGMLIPWIISQAADQNGGGKIVLGNVTPKRDFIFIDDVVTAIQAISRVNPGAAGAAEIFNIGSGVSASPGDIVNMLAQITGKKLEIVSEESRVRKGEADEERAGISTLEKIGWKPLIMLPDGLERTWQKTKK